MVRWVFLDVGNVLLDEDPLTFVSFLRHAEAVRRRRPDHSFLDLLAEREAKAAAGSRWPVYEVVASILDDAECAEVWNETAREVRARFDELSPLIPGASELIEHLAERYHMGLIANQGLECRARLAGLGLLDRFEVVAFSEEHGVAKPDPALFLHALRESGADPAQCLMVGDRLDNDLAPAIALGMGTAWIRWPDRTAKGWQPDEPEAIAYRDSLERSAARSASLFANVRPSVIVDEVRELERAVGVF